MWYNSFNAKQYGSIAQLGEHPPDARKVKGSSPFAPILKESPGIPHLTAGKGVPGLSFCFISVLSGSQISIPNSSGRNRGQTFSFVTITADASLVPISHASPIDFP